MIRLGSQIRLSRREVERFLKITDIEPVGIRTIEDLEAYIARCKVHYWGVSKETRFLHWLIDREAAQCRQAAYYGRSFEQRAHGHVALQAFSGRRS